MVEWSLADYCEKKNLLQKYRFVINKALSPNPLFFQVETPYVKAKTIF